MSSRLQTLLEYLRIPDPALNGTQCPKGGNTTGTTYDTPYEIAEWTDFNFETLTSIYGGKLNRLLTDSFDLIDFSNIPECPFREIYDENSFEGFLDRWTWPVVSDALAKSQPRLLDLQHFVYMVKGGQAPSPRPKKKDGNQAKERKWKPDWGCRARDKSTDPQAPINDDNEPSLLPGDSKLSTKWSSSEITIGRVENRWGSKSKLSPLRQIYSYCVNHNRRYGYLITDVELVVIRIRFLGDNGLGADLIAPNTDTLRALARESGVLEYKAIPWQSTPMEASRTAGGLTMNMALWFLHLLAIGNTNIGVDYGNLGDAVWAPVIRNRSNTPSRPELIKPRTTPNKIRKNSQKATDKGQRRSFRDQSSSLRNNMSF